MRRLNSRVNAAIFGQYEHLNFSSQACGVCYTLIYCRKWYIAISVCMNSYILQIIRGMAIKFGENVSYKHN